MIDAELAHAEVLMDAGKSSDALAVLTGRLASSPDDVTATILATRAFIELGDNPNALDFARRSAALAPDNADSWILVALAEARYARWKPAMTAWRRAVELEPTSWRSHAVRAEIDFIKLRHSKDGKAAALKAVELEPEIVDTHLLAGRYWELLVKPRTANAAYLRALAIDPQHVEASRLHAALQASFGNGGKVLAGRMDELAANPDSPEAHLLLRQIVISVLRPVQVVLALAIYLSAGLPGRGGTSAGIDPFPTPPLELQLLLAAAAIVISGIFLVRAMIQLGPRTKTLVRALVPHDRVITAILVALALGVVAVVVCPFLPLVAAYVVSVAATALLAGCFLLGFVLLNLKR